MDVSDDQPTSSHFATERLMTAYDGDESWNGSPSRLGRCEPFRCENRPTKWRHRHKPQTIRRMVPQ